MKYQPTCIMTAMLINGSSYAQNYDRPMPIDIITLQKVTHDLGVTYFLLHCLLSFEYSLYSQASCLLSEGAGPQGSGHREITAATQPGVSSNWNWQLLFVLYTIEERNSDGKT